jgi:site-specific recombinase XerD
MSNSVHDPEKVLDYWVKKVETDVSSKRNKELILGFKEECLSLELSYSRIKNFMQHLWKISTWVEKDFDKMEKEDIKKLCRIIKRAKYKRGKKLIPYTAMTKLCYKETIKKLFQWLEGYEWSSKKFPEKVDFIKLTRKINDKKKIDVLTKQEVKRLIMAGKNERDRADLDFIETLYSESTSPISKATIVCALKRMEKVRRNKFYSKIKGEDHIIDVAIEWTKSST